MNVRALVGRRCQYNPCPRSSPPWPPLGAEKWMNQRPASFGYQNFLRNYAVVEGLKFVGRNFNPLQTVFLQRQNLLNLRQCTVFFTLHVHGLGIMGRRSTKTTKAGKYMNPTDQWSK